MKKNYACGVDIGGSHATAAVIDLTSNTILKESIRRSAIDASGSADSIISQWVSVIKNAFSGSGELPLNIGIAMPGPFDYEEGISYIKGQNKYEALYEMNVKQMLAKALGQPGDTITFANDAACFLQGEVADGVAKGYENVLGFTLGTGLGASLFSHGIAEDIDLWRTPFLDGIAEDYLSTRWFLKRYKALSSSEITDVKELAERSPSDSNARAVFTEFGKNFGDFILQAVKAQHVDIQMVVIGGNIAHAIELFKSGMDGSIVKLPAPLQIQKSILGENAALIGAVSINTIITEL